MVDNKDDPLDSAGKPVARDTESLIRRTLIPFQLTDPRQIGDYTVLGRLKASSGPQHVFLASAEEGVAAQDLGQGALVVIKTISVEAPSHLREWFDREVQNLQRVKSERVAELLEAGTVQEGRHKGLAYLVQRYVDGPPLDEYRQRHWGDQPMPRKAADQLAVQLLEALRDVHEAKVVHRDIKPDNVIRGSNGVVLVDFGISHWAGEFGITMPGLVRGTVITMSPEQLTADVEIDSRSDVFSWAVAVAWTVSGRHPFLKPGEITNALDLERVRKLITSRTPDLDGVHQPLARCLAEAMATDPGVRPEVPELLERLTASPKQTKTAVGVVRLLPVGESGGAAPRRESWGMLQTIRELRQEFSEARARLRDGFRELLMKSMTVMVGAVVITALVGSVVGMVLHSLLLQSGW